MKQALVFLPRTGYPIRVAALAALLLILVIGLGPVYAQEGGKVQLLTGRVEPGAGAFYLLPNLKQGQTLYVYAQGTSGNLDPLLLLSDETLNRFTVRDEFWADVERAIAAGRDPLEVVPEFADQFFLAWDDDSGLGYAAALEYPIPADGDYKLAVVSTPTVTNWKLCLFTAVHLLSFIHRIVRPSRQSMRVSCLAKV